MKYFIAKLLRGAYVSLFIVSCARNVVGGPSTYIAVEVRQGSVFIQGNRVTRQTTLSEYQTILGKPDRVTNLYKDRATPLQNTINTYDDLGIHLYQRQG